MALANLTSVNLHTSYVEFFTLPSLCLDCNKVMHETTPRYTKDIGVLKVHKDRVLMFFVPHLVIDASRSEVSTSIQASSASA